MRSFLIAAIILATPVSADIISDAWGIATDPFKLGEASQNSVTAVKEARAAVLAAITATSELQGKLDEDIRFYLDDLDSKIENIESLGNNFIREVNDLEEKIVQDVYNILAQAECTAIRIGENSIGNQVLDRLPPIIADDETQYRMPFGTQKKRILWGIISWGEEPAVFVVKKDDGLDPYAEFRQIEAAYLKSLSEAPPNGEAILIASTYANLANLAAKTACLYQDTQFNELFMARKFAEYNAKIIPWGKAIRVSF